jgi:deoxyinosine 3'endonuclease (endonuclease V)
MADVRATTELKKQELLTLKGRVGRRVKLKPAPKRVRRIAGLDIMLTPGAARVHVGTCLMSFPKFDVIEEAMATDEMDDAMYGELGNVVFVPLILSVLKMLKNKFDLVMIREINTKQDPPMASLVGVIAGRPAVGVSEGATRLSNLSKLDGVRRAGPVRVRGRKTPLGVIAGHLVTFKDASSLVKACIKESRVPEPVRVAGLRVRAWEREWRKMNLGRG